MDCAMFNTPYGLVLLATGTRAIVDDIARLNNDSTVVKEEQVSIMERYHAVDNYTMMLAVYGKEVWGPSCRDSNHVESHK